MKFDARGREVVSSQPTSNFYLDISRGQIPGFSIVQKFGRNAAVPNGSWASVNLTGTFQWLTTASTVRVKAGGNAADDAAGAGAQSITIEGLDETGAEASESIATAGASASASTTTTFIRTFRFYVSDSSAGAYTGANTGAITLETTGGTTLMQMAAGTGQSQFGAYTIPLGKTGYLMAVDVMADAAKAADFRMFTRSNILDTTTPYSPKRLKRYWDGILGSEVIRSAVPLLKLPALTDIWMEAMGSGAGTEVSVDMEILLEDT